MGTDKENAKLAEAVKGELQSIANKLMKQVVADHGTTSVVLENGNLRIAVEADPHASVVTVHFQRLQGPDSAPDIRRAYFVLHMDELPQLRPGQESTKLNP